MTDPDPPALEAFEQQVHDCLAHLYDYVFLHHHPLVRQLAPDVSGTDQVQAFRQIVIAGVECLNPGAGHALDSRQARSYNILTLRYVEEQPAQEVMQQLALSERQFYREHRKAIQAIAMILLERLEALRADEPAQPERVISLESEVQRMQLQAEQSWVDLLVLLDSAAGSVQTLANQHGVIVEQAVSDPSPVLYTNRTVLRQVVVWVLSQLIVHSRAGDRLRVMGEATGKQCRLIFTLAGRQIDAAALQAEVVASEALKYLLDTLEAGLSYTQPAPDTHQLTLELRLEQRTVLVIDDNPDVIDLFRRYLAGQAYQLVGVGEGRRAIQTAREIRPQIIILDVMMPGQDGWEILQNLKTHPVTRPIPVLVCSVLDAPDLAFSLGADGFVKKPPGRVDFLNALTRWQG